MGGEQMWLGLKKKSHFLRKLSKKCFLYNEGKNISFHEERQSYTKKKELDEKTRERAASGSSHGKKGG